MSSTIPSLKINTMSPKTSSQGAKTPKTPKTPRGSKKNGKHSDTTKSPASVSPTLAHLTPNDLQIQWQYHNETLIQHQHEAELLVRKLASLQAQHDAGEFQKPRPLLRKMAVLQRKIFNSTTQQGRLMSRVNELALEIRHRQFMAQEFHQRMCSPQAAFFHTGYYYPAPMEMTQSMPIPSTEDMCIEPTTPITKENLASVESDANMSGFQTRERTPSLESDMSWDEMVEEESRAASTPNSDCMSTSSCPTTPKMVVADINDIDMSALSLSMESQKRRQSMCVTPTATFLL